MRKVTFWYRQKEDSIKVVIGVRECKQPERTREWKRLTDLFYGNVYGYGYGWFNGAPEEVFFKDEFKYENK
jgi:hypothetical protein